MLTSIEHEGRWWWVGLTPHEKHPPRPPGEEEPMTTALIVICIVCCIAVILAIVTHLGVGIASDKIWRERISRDRFARWRRRRRVTR